VRSRILRWQSGAAGWRWSSVEEKLELVGSQGQGKASRASSGHRAIGAVFCGHLKRRSRSDPTTSGRSFLPSTGELKAVHHSVTSQPYLPPSVAALSACRLLHVALDAPAGTCSAPSNCCRCCRCCPGLLPAAQGLPNLKRARLRSSSSFLQNACLPLAPSPLANRLTRPLTSVRRSNKANLLFCWPVFFTSPGDDVPRLLPE
jgi:hypothetical protein